MDTVYSWFIIFSLLAALILTIMAHTYRYIRHIIDISADTDKTLTEAEVHKQVSTMSSKQMSRLTRLLSKDGQPTTKLLLLFCSFSLPVAAGAQSTASQPNQVWGEAGVIITVILLLIPILAGVLFMAYKIRRIFARFAGENNSHQAAQIVKYLEQHPDNSLLDNLNQRQQALAYRLSNHELSGDHAPADTKGLLSLKPSGLPYVATKRKAIFRTPVDPAMSKLIMWYLFTAAFWLLFGTTIGEYLGIKFVAPDIELSLIHI